jgi:ABC-type lipoprotein release transport system permease subunit
VNHFLETFTHKDGKSTSVQLKTYEREKADSQVMERFTYGLFGFTDVIVTLAAALVVGMVNRIAISNRLAEISLLHAVGYPKQRLMWRLVIEISATVCVGWVAGLVCAWALSYFLNDAYKVIQGNARSAAISTPFYFTLPIPLIVIVWINADVRRLLTRLDTVSIIERGKLSMENHQPARVSKPKQSGPQRSGVAFSNPLSALTFFARHRRRGLLLIFATGLMVLGVAFPAFVVSMLSDSTAPLFLSYLIQGSIVSSGPLPAVDSTILAQIRSHPAVAHVIPVKTLTMMVTFPPGVRGEMPVYAVHEQDLDPLLNAYGLHLATGALIQPRSNQIMLTRALAQNRGLSVGTTVGEPVCEYDGIPTEMIVAGLLESTGPEPGERAGYDLPSTPRWMGFASYEFVESHERYAAAPIHAIILPVAGRESEMERWLENTIDSSRIHVATFSVGYDLWQELERDSLLLLGVAEVVLAVVAAIGLAILNYIFFIQRRDEFGILHAVGQSRARLITRTLRESTVIVSVAWLIGAMLCVASLIYAQVNIYEPYGIRIGIYNPGPFLFSLPIPVVVIAASVGTIAWALVRLDPVAIIERR